MASRRRANVGVVDVVGPHHEGVLGRAVLVGRVVALAGAGGRSRTAGRAPGRLVRHPDLEGEGRRAPAIASRQRPQQEHGCPCRRRWAGSTARVVTWASGSDVHHAAVADDPPVDRGHEVGAPVALGQLREEQPRGHGRGYTCSSMRSTPRRWRRASARCRRRGSAAPDRTGRRPGHHGVPSARRPVDLGVRLAQVQRRELPRRHELLAQRLGVGELHQRRRRRVGEALGRRARPASGRRTPRGSGGRRRPRAGSRRGRRAAPTRGRRATR